VDKTIYPASQVALEGARYRECLYQFGGRATWITPASKSKLGSRPGHFQADPFRERRDLNLPSAPAAFIA